jgi:hypothetical protein
MPSLEKKGTHGMRNEEEEQMLCWLRAPCHA